MRLLQKSLVPLAQRGKPLLDDAEGFLVVHLDLCVLHDRGIHVIHMHGLVAEHLLAVAVVAVQERQILVDRLQKIVVDLDINILGRHCHGKAGVILPCAGNENVLVHVCHIGGGNGVDEPDIRFVVRLERRLAYPAVGVLEQHSVSAVRDLDGLAVYLDGGEGEVGVVQHTENLTAAVKHVGTLRKNLLRFL